MKGRNSLPAFHLCNPPVTAPGGVGPKSSRPPPSVAPVSQPLFIRIGFRHFFASLVAACTLLGRWWAHKRGGRPTMPSADGAQCVAILSKVSCFPTGCDNNTPTQPRISTTPRPVRQSEVSSSKRIMEEGVCVLERHSNFSVCLRHHFSPTSAWEPNRHQHSFAEEQFDDVASRVAPAVAYRDRRGRRVGRVRT